MAKKKPPRPPRHEQPQVPVTRQSVSRRLESAASALTAAYHALSDFTDASRDWRRRETDFQNFVINSRRFTFMLNRLKNEAGYAEWWQPWAERLGEPIPQFFNALRTTAEHQSSIKLWWSSSITTPSEDFDGSLRMEWEPDGSGHRFINPVTGEEIPLTQTARLVIDDDRVPKEYENLPAEDLMRSHLDLLTAIMRSASSRFGGQEVVD